MPRHGKMPIDYTGSDGIRAKKRYGQNFIRDRQLLARIVECSGAGSGDAVLEIGPGLGGLTALLAEKAGFVYAVEIDPRLIPVLEDKLNNKDNVLIVQGDIMKLELPELLGSVCEGSSVRVVANLPYYITTPVLMKLLFSGFHFRSITVMVQEEVADRMCAAPGSRIYGSLSVAVQYKTEAEVLFRVAPECFTPRPKVYSAVVNMAVREKPPFKVEDEDFFFDIVRAAFAQRRKTLVNALNSLPYLSGRKEELIDIVTQMGFSSSVRGEELGIEEFSLISEKLKRYKL